MIINGREYPLWSQFVNRKKEWIGADLVDYGDSIDAAILGIDGSLSTEITDIRLEPNGEDSAFFSVVGEAFTCGFDVQTGGICAPIEGEKGITFSGYGGHKWRISK